MPAYQRRRQETRGYCRDVRGVSKGRSVEQNTRNSLHRGRRRGALGCRTDRVLVVRARAVRGGARVRAMRGQPSRSTLGVVAALTSRITVRRQNGAGKPCERERMRDATLQGIGGMD